MSLLLAYSLLWRVLPAAVSEPTGLRAVLDAAAPIITPAPRYAPQKYHGLDYRGLFHRQADEGETCGYWDASAGDPYTCSVGLACASNTDYDIFGCCVTDINGEPVTASCPALVNPYTSCIEYVDSDSCTGDCWTSNRVCDSTLPFCAVAYSYTGANTYTNWFCQSLAGATPSLLIYATTTDGDTGTSSSRSSSRTTTSRSSSTSSQDIDDGGDDEPTPTPDPEPKKDGTDKGAIAGGVIGGLAGLALIVGGAIFFLRRAKTKERKAAIAEVSQI